MARRILIVSIILFLGGVCLWFRSSNRLDASDFGVPQYQLFNGPTNIPSFGSCRYNWSTGRPSPNRILIEAWGTNGSHDYFYDLQRHELVGEVRNAEPIMMNKDQTRLLCYIGSKKSQPHWVRSVKGFLRDISGRRFIPKDYETVGIFDLKSHSVTPLGELANNVGDGSDFINSPGWRYAYNQTSTMEKTPMLALCDVEQETMKIVDVGGKPVGWWDATHILSFSTKGDLVLYDADANTRKPLLTRDRGTEQIQQHGWPINADPRIDRIIKYGSMDPVRKWNGHEYCFYLVRDKCWIKIEKEGPSLRLLGCPVDFRYEAFGAFDETESYYICGGNWDAGTASAVYIRGLKDGSERVLVPSDGSNRRSSPAVFGDTVIYERSNAVWQISLSSSNITRLFPPR